jgi:hypothetical protein
VLNRGKTDELYKAAKLEANGDVKSKGKAPMVEDEEEDDGYAGPELPPDFESEDIPDDEEGRFFGGGMERETAQAMNYIDEQDQGGVTVWAETHRVLGPIADFCIEREIRCRVAQALCPKLRKEDIQECGAAGEV